MDFTKLSIKQRADLCENIYNNDRGNGPPKCADHFLDNQECGNICCGHCPHYTTCTKEKCRKVWINPRLVMDNPVGRLIYVDLATGELVTGSVPCIISEMYDDNE
ncbi:MAG: hypothetical protein HQP61_01810 [Peptococcaceae bacterium]|nr:hypothetical protein [Candidatus Syntrophopropionicum ammoniitolerans]